MDGLGGGGGTEITTATANPKVPKGFEGLADMLRMISAGTLASPMNFGPTGLDAPVGGPLVPQASMGSLMTSTPYRMGTNRMNIGGGGRMGQPRGRSLGTSSTTMPASWGDLFTRKPPAKTSVQRDKPYRDSQEKLAANV